jgi:hypothetical protein
MDTLLNSSRFNREQGPARMMAFWTTKMVATDAIATSIHDFPPAITYTDPMDRVILTVLKFATVLYSTVTYHRINGWENVMNRGRISIQR